MHVGFIGLGKMGGAMANNLAKAGHRVCAWNRSPVNQAAFPKIEIVGSPADAMQAEVVFTMLSDDASIRQVLLDTCQLDRARAGLIHVVTATISIAFSKALAADHARRGISYVAAPVFGRPEAAEAKQLNVLVAGDPEAIVKVTPLLEAIAKKVWPLGSEPSRANAAKIAGNMMITVAIESLAEAFALVGHNGVAPEEFLDLMLGTLFGSRAYEIYGRKIISGDFEPGFRMKLGLKDLRLATAAADEASVRLPMLNAVHSRMARAIRAGLGEKDWSAIADWTFR